MSKKAQFIKMAMLGHLAKENEIAKKQIEKATICGTCDYAQVFGLNASKTIALFKCVACRCQHTIDERIILNKPCPKAKWK